MIVPYGAYACADGDVMFAIQTDREWRRFCADVMQAPSLADDPRYVDERERVANRVGARGDDRSALSLAARAPTSIALLERRRHSDGRGERRARRSSTHPQLAARNRWTHVESPGGDIPALHSAAQSSAARRRAWDAFPRSANTRSEVLARACEPHDVGTPDAIRAKHVVRSRRALGR